MALRDGATPREEEALGRHHRVVSDVKRSSTTGLRSVVSSHSVSSIMRLVSVTRAYLNVAVRGFVNATGSSSVSSFGPAPPFVALGFHCVRARRLQRLDSMVVAGPASIEPQSWTMELNDDAPESVRG
jgi:hypothetical protein